MVEPGSRPQKARLKVNMDELAYAFENCSREMRYFLDLENGAVVVVSDYDDEKEELEEKVEQELGKRYLAIPCMGSEEAYRDMVDFIGSVEDRFLKEKLQIAVDGEAAFRRFKNVLLSYPEERERWFKFKEECVKERVRDWLELEGIEL
ncbi:MAG: UPF0158 family protein [Thermoplasmata archaeon]